MNFSENQRRLYLLSGVLLALTIALCATWGLRRKPSAPAAATAPTPAPIVETTPSPAPGAPLAATSDAVVTEGVETARTVVYYQDNYGYLVPVTRTVPMEEGIARATLGLMVQGAYNDMEAARLGLRTVIPEGTDIDLDISDGSARVDLGKNARKCADAAGEANMIAAIVQTLTEFPTVRTVSFLIEGQETATLPHGASIAGKFARGTLNLESSAALSPGEAKTVMLYFPGDAASLLVPVTRMVYGQNDLPTAVLELAKGPSVSSPLESVLPAGCGLISVKVDDAGVATVNFTREFIRIAENTDGGRLALRAIVLTCTQFEGVSGVKVQVEGEDYDPGESTLAVPTFVNDAGSIAEEFIRTQTASILELD